MEINNIPLTEGRAAFPSASKPEHQAKRPIEQSTNGPSTTTTTRNSNKPTVKGDDAKPSDQATNRATNQRTKHQDDVTSPQ